MITDTESTVQQRRGFALASAGPGALFALQGFYLLYFYTDVAQIPTAVVTAGLLVVRVWDVVNDPLVGWWSDRSGRRRRFVMLGAIPTGAATWLALSIPDGLEGAIALIVLVVTYAVWDAAITVVHVPLYALAVDNAGGYDARTRMVASGAVGALVGYILAGVGSPLLAGLAPSLSTGYRWVGAVVGLGVASVVGIGSARLPESDRPRADETTMGRTLRRAATNSPLRRLVVPLALVRLGFTIASATLAYFVVHHLGEPDDGLAAFVGVLLVATACSIPLWRRLAMTWDKPSAYRLGLTVAAVGLAATWFVPAGGTSMVLALTAVVGVGSGSHWVIPWSMLPDTADHGGDTRYVGTYFGVYGVVEKLTRSAALLAVSGALALLGYDPTSNAAGTVVGIRLFAGPLPALALVTASATLARYPLDRTTVEKPIRTD